MCFMRLRFVEFKEIVSSDGRMTVKDFVDQSLLTDRLVDRLVHFRLWSI